MFAWGKNEAFVISFPDLSSAQASILAKELARELALDATKADQITLARASDDAQDLGSILVVAAGSGLGAGLIELAECAGKEFAKGVMQRAGQKFLDVIWPILRKWATRAKVEDPSGSVLVIGEEYSRHAAPRSVADAETLAELKTLGLVILGASSFPRYPASLKLDNEAFKLSAELAKQVPFAHSYGIPQSGGARPFRPGSQARRDCRPHRRSRGAYAGRAALLLRTR